MNSIVLKLKIYRALDDRYPCKEQDILDFWYNIIENIQIQYKSDNKIIVFYDTVKKQATMYDSGVYLYCVYTDFWEDIQYKLDIKYPDMFELLQYLIKDTYNIEVNYPRYTQTPILI